MSISKFQEKYLRKGCATVIALAMASVFLGFGFNNQCGRNAGMNQPQGDQEDRSLVAKVGDIPVTTDAVQKAQATITSQAPAGLAYPMQARSEAEAVYAAASQAAYAYIAQRDHIPITDQALLKGVEAQIQRAIEQEKMQLMFSGKVKDPKDMDAAFKQATGRTADEIVRNSLTQAREDLQDKDKRARLVAEMAPELVRNAFESKFVPSDAELRASYQVYVVKRVLIAAGTKNPSVDAMVAEVEAALKAGLDFDKAIDKFSSDPPTASGKKISDNTFNVTASMMQTDPQYKDLQGQRPGFVSPPVAVPNGKAIYKIVSVRTDLPKDFDKNIARYRSDYAKQKVNGEVQKQVNGVLTSSTTSWNNLGDKALFEYTQAFGTTDPATTNTQMRKVADDAKAARVKGDVASLQPATDAWFLAFDTLYNTRGADKSKMQDERIEVLNAVLQHTEDFSLRMELVDLYVAKKDWSNALGNLVAASHANTDYAGLGTQHFGDIMAKRNQIKKLGQLTDAQLKDLDAAQDSWRVDKAGFDKQAEETKREEAKAKAAQAEIDRKNAEELAKQKAEAAKNAPPPSPAPSPGRPVSPKGTTPPKGAGVLPPGLVFPRTPKGNGSILPPGSVPSGPGKGPGGQ